MPERPVPGVLPVLPIAKEVATGEGLYPLWLRPPFPAGKSTTVPGLPAGELPAAPAAPLKNTAFDRALRYLTWCDEEMAETGAVDHLSSCLTCSLRLLEVAGIPEAVELSPFLDRLDAEQLVEDDEFEFDHIVLPATAQCAAGGTGGAGEQLVFEDRGAAESAAAVVDLACGYDYGSSRNTETAIQVDTDAAGTYLSARVHGVEPTEVGILDFGALPGKASLACTVFPSALPGPGRVLASFRMEVPDDDSCWRLRLFSRDWVLLDSGACFSVLLAAGDYVVELLADDGRRSEHTLHVVPGAVNPGALYDIQ